MKPVYTQEEVIENFQALIDSWDFSAELRQLGIGPMQLMRRRQMLLEFRGLLAGLWRLALTRSFPEDGQQIFEGYLESCLQNPKNSHKARPFVERARQYAAMLAVRGDSDFSEVSRHVASFLKLSEVARKSTTFKLALDIRQMYTFVFDRMI